MEPIIIALICAASFGIIVAFAAFIRQLLISRDKRLNDEAQRTALNQEALELQKMREQMHNNSRFDSHYKVLGSNKDAIAYLDTKFEDIMKKKTELVERYCQISIKESQSIVNGDVSVERKIACDRLKKEMDEQIKFYDAELLHLQERRSTLWVTQKDLEGYLLGQEKARNENLDTIYKQHSGILEKIYIRHTDDSENIAKQTIDAGTTSFKDIILAPIQFLLQYFNLSSGINLDQSKIEQEARDEVSDTEDDVNEPENSDGDVKSDDEVDQNTDEEAEIRNKSKALVV